jgi:putative endonuclease
MTPQELGKLGERVARRHLERTGYKILASNYYCPMGELDLVARDHESLTFVEVKCRKGGHGFEQAIGPRKIKKLYLTARAYMQDHGLSREDYRFLVVYVLVPLQSHQPVRVKVVEDPF